MRSAHRLPHARPFAFALCVTFALTAGSRSQQVVTSVNGPTAGSQYGKACITIPDQNGDGYKDVLVGAPGFNQQRGEILCLSGAFLAFGTGTQTLWSVAPTTNQGDLFGYALADLGDVTNDGVHDYLVGQPGYDFQTSQDVGAVRVVNGASHVIVSLRYAITTGGMFGSSVAATGDVSGDGITEVAVGAPGPNSNASAAYMFDNGAQFLSSGPVSNFTAMSTAGPVMVGASLASGFDLDGDNIQEIAIGVPGLAGTAGADAGEIVIMSRASALHVGYVRTYEGQFAGERLGTSIDAAHDYDGDGVVDIVVGAPNSPNGTIYEAGRAVVLSGARLLANTPPFEIRSLPFGSPSAPPNHTDPNPDFHFGAAVRACADLNHDGVGDILVGAPDFYSMGISGIAFKGLVRVYSGATGSLLAGITGGTTDRLGDALAGAIDDLDGDGMPEFVIGGSLSDAGGADSGVVKCYRLFPLAPSIYCTAKLNSLGCTPAISFSGSPSASSLAPFAITASNFINQKTGLLFYSHSSATTAFQGGFKCAGDPVRRTGALHSGGSTSGSDCTGVYSLDFNARIANGVDPSLTAGAEVFAQYWSRDPASVSHTSLSNAVRFVINP